MKVNRIGTISLWFINLWCNTCMYDSPPQIFLIIQLNLNYHFTHPCPQKSGLEKSWRREIKSVRFREGDLSSRLLNLNGTPFCPCTYKYSPSIQAWPAMGVWSELFTSLRFCRISICKVWILGLFLDVYSIIVRTSKMSQCFSSRKWLKQTRLDF